MFNGSYIKPTLFFIMVMTLVFSIWVRLMVSGWYLILFGIPLLILAEQHFVFQVSAIRKVSKMKPSHILLILVSNLFFFLGFALQVDAGDAPGAFLAVAVFYNHYFGNGAGGPMCDGQFYQCMYPSIYFLVALIASWFFLLRTSFWKRENSE